MLQLSSHKTGSHLINGLGANGIATGDMRGMSWEGQTALAPAAFGRAERQHMGEQRINTVEECRRNTVEERRFSAA
jgi:hypothetical protein